MTIKPMNEEKQRIAYISSAAYADVDISLLNALQKYADVTYYICLGPGGLRQTAIDLSRNRDLKDGIIPALDIPELKQFEMLVDLSKMYVYYNSGKHSYSLTSIKNGIKLYKHLKAGSFNVYHFTSPLTYSQFPLYRFRSRSILTVHDPFPHSSMNNRNVRIIRYISFKLFKHFILLNKAQRAQFLNTYHIKKNNVYDSSLSCYTFLKAYAKDTNPNGDYILFFGNISSYKGIEYLCESMIMVHDVYPNCKVIIAGNGKYYFDINEYENKDYFDFRNRFIPTEELATLIKHAKIVVVPYVDATQSGVVMSAYAFTKPCIVTNVGGLPEMVGGGELGVIVEPRDINALGNAIIDCLSNAETLLKYSEKIQKAYGEGEQSWDAIAKRLITFYSKLYH